MHGLVGGAAGGQESNHGINHGFLTDHMGNRDVVITEMGHGRNPYGRRPGQCVTQFRTGIDKGGAWQMHTQHFRHQLIGIGRAVKGAGTGTVIGFNLGGQHLFTAYFSQGKKFTVMGLFLVGQARGHGSCRYQDHGQMAELESAHE